MAKKARLGDQDLWRELDGLFADEESAKKRKKTQRGPSASNGVMYLEACIPYREYGPFVATYLRRKKIDKMAMNHPSSTCVICFYRQNNFTLAEIKMPSGDDGKILARGISKRLPTDKLNHEVGRRLALWRALDDFYQGGCAHDHSNQTEEEV